MSDLSDFVERDLVPPTAPQLLSTKLYPPRLRPNLVARAHLDSVLAGDPDRQLTVVCAPAGYGKSTLVAQWLTQTALPLAWVSLEASDNNPRSFFGLVVAALHTIDRSLAANTEALLVREGRLSAGTIVHELIGELSATTRSFVLVLDDYHVIEEPEIHRAMDQLLQHVPITMKVVLISRGEPPLRLARLRTRGELSYLGREDLQFTHTEALDFYQEFLGLDLAPSDVELIRERTEGWVTGLQLVGFMLRGQPRDRVRRIVEESIDGARFGDQYLWEEILQHQPDDVRTFLLHTCILDRFSAGLCDAVTGNQDGGDIVRRCEREGLFIVPLDGHGAWYRYHHLFADVLRERLARTATEVEFRDLHRRASTWLDENGYGEDAIRHAIAGQDWDRAIGLLEQICATLFERDHVAAIRDWLESVPLDILGRSPRLAFFLAWSLGRTGRWSQGVQPLRLAEQTWTALDDPLGTGLIALWYASRAVYEDDNRRAIEFADRALEYLPEDRTYERIFALMTRGIAHHFHGEPLKAEQIFAAVRRLVDATGKTWLQPFEMVYSAATLSLRGKLLESTSLARQIVRAAGEHPSEIWVQAALYELGKNYLEWNMLDDAERIFRRARDLAEMTGALHWRSRIHTGLARIAWAREEHELAQDEIALAIASAGQADTPQLVRIARARQARFWLASRQIALARRWADSCELDPYLPPEYERRDEHLTYVRLLLHEDRSDLALRIMARIYAQAQADGRDGDLVEIHIVTALAHKAGGNTADAVQCLHNALELASPDGYVRVFLDETEELEHLLRYVAARGNQREYAQHILSAVEGAPATIQHIGSARSNGPDALSEREAEVLRLVAVGLSNRDIGERLFISEKTVKTHLSNILGKLGAANRTQAVEQAHRMGLF